MSRSVAQYRCRERDEETLRVPLRELAARYRRYGYLHLHVLLAGEGLVVDAERTWRHYREGGCRCAVASVDDCSRDCHGQIVDLSISGERLARLLDELAEHSGLLETLVMDIGLEPTRNAMFE